MAEEYKKISDLAEMLASDINSSTKMVVTTGELKGSRNLNVSDLVVGNLSTNSDYRALSAGMGKKLNDEKAPVLNPIFTGTVSGVTKAMVGLSNVDNTADASKPISAATQIALNSKVSAENATLTGYTNFEGNVQVSEDIIVDGNVRSYSNTVDTRLQFGPSATIKIQTGVSGGTPIYREFPATELSSSDLNGSNYVMVYGTGTPTDNAAELQAAYNEAKKMPRHLGTFSPGDSIEIYKGQTFVNSAIPITHVMVANSNYSGAIALAPTGTFSKIDSQSELDAALARRVSVIVAPGEYNFGATAFVVDTPYINIVSLTGNSDVIISSIEEHIDYRYIYGIKVTANDILIKGINCKTNTFYIANNLNNLICEYCTGGWNSFGSGINATSGTFNNCIGGNYSFGSDSTISGTFNNCIGGGYSFGYQSDLTGNIINCKLISGTFPTPMEEGKIYNSIDGNGNLINTPLPVFADNAAAASLATGALYRTATGVQMIKY